MSSRYHQTIESWRRDPNAFWAEAARGVHWQEPYREVFDAARSPFVKWFPGGKVNTCYNAVDRHVEAGHGQRRALVYDSPVTTTQKVYSYADLRDEVARAAGALRRIGVGVGDRVLLYMPMVPEALISMLACARLGAVHSVVFGGFAAKELATRIDDARPRVILSASCGIEIQKVIAYKPLLDEALRLSSHTVDHCVVLQRPELEAPLVEGRDVAWKEFVRGAEPAECVPVDANAPLYILYTSGTTGVPKGVVRDNAGHMVALHWSMHAIYGAEPGDVYWAASDIGWVVGHSYIVYAPLLRGCTTLLYEGKPVGTPDAGAFWRVIEEHSVNVLFTAPTAFRAIKREDPEGKLLAPYDLSTLRTLFLAGERADPDTLNWAEKQLSVPVIDHWWQTETGWPIVANYAGLGLLEIKHGSPSLPAPGYDVQVLDAEGSQLPAGETGAIAIRLPLPPGCLPTLWHNDEGFVASYLEQFPGYYNTGDAGYIDADGYVYIMSRTDDLINVAGHRLSTGAMEEVLCDHPDVAEAAVVGVADALKGEVPLGFLVINAGCHRTPSEIVTEVIAAVRQRIGPVASFKLATVVERLPKTRSGKVLRGTMKKLADGTACETPATIDDPLILDEIKRALAELGYPSANRHHGPP